ncbi:hypothetical protein RB620_04480 [Paenibacillus sp. LHD-117]|uniref:hypothetical protein n=1 Tax=Paenibacillus sp. LHD-117 TaxID=3071412 RepID=UPI0027DFFD3D|nr:hypothetical protein [Paenibacillus sp. LHD-117]MDQ6418689.1 hypothetical protein [Paenibacillus sp. LHD-117]
MGYGMKMHHKFGPKSRIATLNYKPKAGEIIEIDGEWYKVDSLEKDKRVCHAVFASNQEIYQVTGSYPG